MSKYAPLQDFLRRQGEAEVAMSFDQIQSLIGESLPRSAFEYRPWWSNNASNSAATKAWLEAGYQTAKVDMQARKLVFRQVQAPVGPSMSRAAREGRFPGWGLLKGTVTLAPGVDLTEPLHEPWANEPW